MDDVEFYFVSFCCHFLYYFFFFNPLSKFLLQNSLVRQVESILLSVDIPYLNICSTKVGPWVICLYSSLLLFSNGSSGILPLSPILSKSLWIEATFREANLADFGKQMLEVIFTYERAVLHALLINHITSKGILTKDEGAPLTELRGADAVDTITHADDSIEVVEQWFTLNVPVAFKLNYSNFSNSSILLQFTILECLCEMLSDAWRNKEAQASEVPLPTDYVPSRRFVCPFVWTRRPFVWSFVCTFLSFVWCLDPFVWCRKMCFFPFVWSLN